MGQAAPPGLRAGPSLFSFHRYLNSGGAALEQILVTWGSCAARLCDLKKTLGEGGNGGAVPAGCSSSSDSARHGTCSAFLVSRGWCGMDRQMAMGRLPATLAAKLCQRSCWEPCGRFASKAPAAGAVEEAGGSSGGQRGHGWCAGGARAAAACKTRVHRKLRSEATFVTPRSRREQAPSRVCPAKGEVSIHHFYGLHFRQGEYNTEITSASSSAASMCLCGGQAGFVTVML